MLGPGVAVVLKKLSSMGSSLNTKSGSNGSSLITISGSKGSSLITISGSNGSCLITISDSIGSSESENSSLSQSCSSRKEVKISPNRKH